MSALISCIKKDRIEVLRKKKNLILILVLLCCMAMVLLTTKFMPTLLQKAMSISDILSNDNSLTEFMEKILSEWVERKFGYFFI